MAIPNNYIDKITDHDSGESRPICPHAEHVSVDNENYEGETLDEVLDEVAQAIEEAGQGSYTPPQGGIPKSDLAQSVQDSLDKADSALQDEDVADFATKTELQQGLGGKQDTINDLASIRTGAGKGATAVQPSDLNSAMATKQNVLTFDNTPTAGSDNPVKSKGVKQAIDEKLSNVTVNAIPAGSVGIIDDCVTDSDTDALSARQGKKLNDRLEELEEGGTGGVTAVFEGTKLVFKAVADLPMIRVSRGRINFPETEENDTRTATFVVKGKNLTNGITLALTDTSGMFSISQNSISAANANGETTITVTYAPTAIGTHSASIALSSGEATNTVELSGTAVEEIVPDIILNDGAAVSLAAESGGTATKTIQVVAMHLQPNEQVTLAVTETNDITVTPATLTADENGSINATATLTYTAGSADASGTLTATCTTIAETTIGVAGHVATRLAAGSYWDDGFFRYTVRSDTKKLNVKKNPNATISGTLTFPASVSDEGKTVRDSGGNVVTASGMSYRVEKVESQGFLYERSISNIIFEAGGVTQILDQAFNRGNTPGTTCDITFNAGIDVQASAFFGNHVGTLAMLGNITGWAHPFPITFGRLDFGEAVTAIDLDIFDYAEPGSGAKIIIRSASIPNTSGSLRVDWKTGARLYVPSALLSAYQAHSVWSNITNILTIENDL